MTIDELLHRARNNEGFAEEEGSVDLKAYYLTKANNYRLRVLITMQQGWTEEPL